ncbi:MAG TPA: hypothetical protein VGK17_22975 [Propionicimonas sp.]|jgi:hypothetical protein
MAFPDETCPACSAAIGSGVPCLTLGFAEAGAGLHDRRRAVIACRSCGTTAGEYHHAACPNDRCVHGIWAACGLCRYVARGHDDLEGRARDLIRRWIVRESS